MAFAKINIISLLLAGCAAVFGQQAVEPEFIVGATMHFGHERGMVAENLKCFKEAGLLSSRDDTAWWVCERQKGLYSVPPLVREYLAKAPEMGITPLQVLGWSIGLYDGWKKYQRSPEAVEAHAKYCEFIVAEYKGKCHLYQMWNEWENLRVEREPGVSSSESYVNLLKAAYPRMKAIDPSITVIANSAITESFLEETLKEGILKFCDGISFHSYDVKQGPERGYIPRIEGVAKLIKKYNNGKDFPLYLTETGWPNSFCGNGSSEQVSGDYMARTFLLIKTIPSVKGLWWYNFQDDSFDPLDSESNFGMVRPDLTPKEPFYVFKSIAEIVRKGKFVERVTAPVDGLVVLKFKMPDGNDVLAAWCALPDTSIQVTLKNTKETKGPLKTFLAGFEVLERDWGAREWAGLKRDAGFRKAAFLPDRFQFTVKSRPFIVMGDLSGVELEKARALAFPDINARRVVVPEHIGLIYPSSKAADKINISGSANYRNAEGDLNNNTLALASKEDLNASFSVSYDKNALTLVVEVEDDVFFQPEEGASTWRGDSVQFALQNLAKDAASRSYSEYTLALTDKGPAVYRTASQIKLPSCQANDIKLDVKREGTKTTYTATIPLQELGIKKLEPGSVIGFSLLVNDNDGKGRKGYLKWGDGIGSGKDPLQYNWLLIKE